MSRMALNIAHFKKGAVGSLGGHNWYKRGEHDEHSNQDIDPQRSKDNIALVLPEEGTFYQDVKSTVEQSTGRVTAASVWVSEWVLYPPEELQDPRTADKDKLRQFYGDALDWMREQGYLVKLAAIHMDETTVHAHIDTVPLTQDGRLSRKEVYTRAALNGIHTDLAAHLAAKGWDIQRGESTKDKQVRSVSVPEFKRQAEAAKLEAIQEAEKATQEALEAEARAKALEGQIGGLQAAQAQLQEQLAQDRERRQYEQARYDELQRVNTANLKIIEENDAIIREQEDTLRLIQTYEEYEGEAEAINQDMDLLEAAAKDLPGATRLFKTSEANAWLQRMNQILKDIRRLIGAGIQRLQIFESRYVVDERLSEPAVKRAAALDEQIFGAASRVQPGKSQGKGKDEIDR